MGPELIALVSAVTILVTQLGIYMKQKNAGLTASQDSASLGSKVDALTTEVSKLSGLPASVKKLEKRLTAVEKKVQES